MIGSSFASKLLTTGASLGWFLFVTVPFRTLYWSSLLVATLAACAVTYLTAITCVRLVRAHVLQNDLYAAYPRPRHTSSKWFWLVGDLPFLISFTTPARAFMAWQEQLQSDVFVYRGLFYSARLVVADLKATHHILGSSQAYHFPKPLSARNFLKSMLGGGLVMTEGDTHKRQRRIIQSAFNVDAIRTLTPLFFRHANAFVRRMEGFIDLSKADSQRPFLEGQSIFCARHSTINKPALDIVHWLNRLTLDVIVEAGFGYSLNAVALSIDQQTDPIVASYQILMQSLSSVPWHEWLLIGLNSIPCFGWVAYVPSQRRIRLQRARRALEVTGRKIIERKRDEIRQSREEQEHRNSESESNDLLHRMIEANLDPDVATESRMSESELLAQICTVLVAGDETTSALLTWFIYCLTQDTDRSVVRTLRAEIEEAFGERDEIDYDSLMAMPYLDNCLRETLRLYTPVAHTDREATRDGVLPLAKGVRLSAGYKNAQQSDVFPVQKGQHISIVLQSLNQNPDMWGDRAHEFLPDRWNDLAQAAAQNGFPRNLATFLEGPRSCVGSYFSMCEFKVIVCALVRSLNFDALPSVQIQVKQANVVIRPHVAGQENAGAQLPVWISRAVDDDEAQSRTRRAED